MAETLSQDIYRTVLEGLPTGVYLVDRDRRIRLWNQGAEELTGYLRQEVLGRLCGENLLVHCDEARACLCGVACPLQETMHDGRQRAADMFLLHKDGHRVPVHVRSVPVRDEHGVIIGAVESFDKRQVMPAVDPVLCQLKEHAPADPVTGLPDHEASELRLHAYLKGYVDTQLPFGVVSIAVGTLETLRHADGRNAVNKVLHATAQTLASTLGPNDMLGRWAEDRFLAVVTNCSTSTLLKTAGMMTRLVGLEGVPWWGDRLKVSLSVGGTVVRAGDSVNKIVQRAEAALVSSLQHTGNYAVVA